MKHHCNICRPTALLVAAALLLSTLVFSGCKSDDTTPPAQNQSVSSNADAVPVAPITAESTGGSIYTVSGCDLTYSLSTDERSVAITGALGEIHGGLVLPEKIDRMPVTEISDRAFMDQKFLTSVTLGDDIETVGADAFRYCSMLSEINLDKVERIGASAFMGCALTSIEPKRLQSLGDLAFKTCFDLKSVVLPACLEQLGGGAFSYCSALSELSIDGKNKRYIVDGSMVLTRDGTCAVMCLPAASGEIAVPGGVTTIMPYCFENCVAVSSVTLPDGLAAIGEYAFNSCISLGDISLPSSVAEIGASAFRDCDSMTGFVMNDTISEIKPFTWFGCNTLKSLTIGSAVSVIGEGAFAGSPKLKNVTVKGGNGSFVCIDGLLYTADRKTLVAAFLIKDIDPKINDYEIPSGIENIGAYAFYGRNDIVYLTVPEGVVTIGNNAFAWNPKLCAIVLPSTLRTIGNSAFEYSFSYSKLKNIPTFVIPDGVTDIGTDLFSYCYMLRSVRTGSSLKSIPDRTFFMCDLLDTVTVLSAETIGSEAFSGCIKLRSLSLPNNLQSIGREAFHSCWAMPSVTLPDSIKSIDDRAFYNCWSLTSITLGSQLETVGSCVFSRANSLGYIGVNEGNSGFVSSDGVLMSSDMTTIYAMPLSVSGDYFIPDGVTSIASGAFCDSSLSRLIVPASLTHIADDAFVGCESSITLCGSPDTPAQHYAQKHGIAFIER